MGESLRCLDELPGAGNWAFWTGLSVVVLSLISGLATYFILTGLTPIAPRNQVVVVVLFINIVLILAMFTVLGVQALGLWRAWQRKVAGARIHVRIVGLFREKEQLLIDTVRALVSAVEAKDDYTSGHSERVALYGQQLARDCGLDETVCDRIYFSGLLHDVGKISIQDSILQKPSGLSDDEFQIIQTHPDRGWVILQELEQLKHVLPGVLYHHERVDGKGYPDGLVGAEIPIDGRILAVADTYDAMTSDRPYRKGMPQDKAEQILRGGAGTQWDSTIVETFLRHGSKFVAIKESYRPRSRAIRVARPAKSVD